MRSSATPGCARADYRPNSSLYHVGDRLLFAEELRGQAGISYRLVAVDTTPYLMQTLTRARTARLGTLAAALAARTSTRADADGYLAELAGSQILVADIRPQLTGPPRRAPSPRAWSGTSAAPASPGRSARQPTGWPRSTPTASGPGRAVSRGSRCLDSLPVTPEPSPSCRST